MPGSRCCGHSRCQCRCGQRHLLAARPAARPPEEPALSPQQHPESCWSTPTADQCPPSASNPGLPATGSPRRFTVGTDTGQRQDKNSRRREPPRPLTSPRGLWFERDVRCTPLGTVNWAEKGRPCVNSLVVVTPVAAYLAAPSPRRPVGRGQRQREVHLSEPIDMPDPCGMQCPGQLLICARRQAPDRKSGKRCRAAPASPCCRHRFPTMSHIGAASLCMKGSARPACECGAGVSFGAQRQAPAQRRQSVGHKCCRSHDNTPYIAAAA